MLADCIHIVHIFTNQKNTLMKKLYFIATCCLAMCLSAYSIDKGIENGHEWVDLGLPSGTKWATCNIGASNPQEYGNYYAWGEVTTKSIYNWRTYKYSSSNGQLTKYNIESRYGRNGFADGKTVLDLRMMRLISIGAASGECRQRHSGTSFAFCATGYGRKVTMALV